MRRILQLAMMGALASGCYVGQTNSEIQITGIRAPQTDPSKDVCDPSLAGLGAALTDGAEVALVEAGGMWDSEKDAKRFAWLGATFARSESGSDRMRAAVPQKRLRRWSRTEYGSSSSWKNRIRCLASGALEAMVLSTSRSVQR